MKIGWIGLGEIGTNMVLRALGAGHAVTVFARGQGLAAVSAAGAETSYDYHSLAGTCDILTLCLFSDAQVRAVLFGEGTLAAMRPGAILSIHTTGSPSLAREIADRAPPGAAVLDATFSGSPQTVLAGELTAMVGGDANVLDRARPLLSSYASTVHHVGPVGHGQMVKLLNNLLFATNLRHAAALLDLAEKQGFKTDDLVPVLQGCSGGSLALGLFAPDGITDTLARTWPFISKDVTTVATGAADAGLDLTAFAGIIEFFTANQHRD